LVGDKIVLIVTLALNILDNQRQDPDQAERHDE